MSSFRSDRRDAVPSGTVSLPGSKSISNRLLVLSYLSGGRLKLSGLSNSSDTRILEQALGELGSDPERIDAADAGTAYRFLTSLLTLVPGDRILDGTERMKERPIGPLVDALRSLGASIEYLGKEGYPPLRIRGGGVKGGKVELRADVSSQYASALALIAPSTEKGIELELLGEAVSRPYFHMTLSILEDLGVPVHRSDRTVRIDPQVLPERHMKVEGDHSSASFWYELLAIAGKGSLFLEGLMEDSLQGDSALPSFFRELGVQERWEEAGCWIEAVPGRISSGPYEADLSQHPDLFPPLAVATAVLGKEALFRGVGNLRLKESDRLEALRKELAGIGVELVVRGDEAGVDPSGFIPDAEPSFRSHSDHRIAMALAPLVSILPSLSIDEREVVSKSYPGFWQSFESILPPGSTSSP